MAHWLSWLERRPVTAEVVGSSPSWVVTIRFSLPIAPLTIALSDEKRILDKFVKQICLVYSGKVNLTGRYGVLAQLGEHLPYKQRVIGSSPIGPTYLDNFIVV